MKVIKLVTIAIISLLPFVLLINDASVFFSHTTGKIFFFRLALIAVSFLFLLDFSLVKKNRNMMVEKIRALTTSPLFLSVFLFIFVFFLSSFFALDSYTAFWGDLQRGEGLVGILFFLVFFVLILIYFEKKDWMLFFKLNLVLSLVLLSGEFRDFFEGFWRPGSFLGNPAFLAGYLLFSVFASLFVFSSEKNKFWRYFSLGILVLSFMGIFITETRGAVLGLCFGIVGVLIYLIGRGRGVFLKQLNLWKISIFILSFIIMFSAFFLVTKNSEFWQRVPGLARVATISREDVSTRTRLLSIESGLASVNPKEGNLKEFLIGWGPDNYIIAFGKYSTGEQYRYETEWFDRAHNKLLDVLVTSGIFGLLAYLAIWFFYFKSILLKRDFSFETLSLIFFGVSYLIYLLFIFDQISTLIPFFAVMGFVIYSYPLSEIALKSDTSKRARFLIGAVAIVLVLCLSYVFFSGDLQAYKQTRKYIAFERGTTERTLDMNTEVFFEPFTNAQVTIRRDFFLKYSKGRDIEDKLGARLLAEAFMRGEEYIERMPFDFRFMADVAGVYSDIGRELGSTYFLKRGEDYFKRAIAFAPERPDYNYYLALNLAYQGRFEESELILDKIIQADPLLADSYYYHGFVSVFQGETKYEEALEYFEKSFVMKPDLLSRNKEEVEDIYKKLRP